MNRAINLMWKPEGPLLEYIDGVLCVADLNPEVHLQWRMSRREMWALGWRCLRAALAAP